MALIVMGLKHSPQLRHRHPAFITVDWHAVEMRVLLVTRHQRHLRALDATRAAHKSFVRTIGIVAGGLDSLHCGSHRRRGALARRPVGRGRVAAVGDRRVGLVRTGQDDAQTGYLRIAAAALSFVHQQLVVGLAQVLDKIRHTPQGHTFARRQRTVEQIAAEARMLLPPVVQDRLEVPLEVAVFARALEQTRVGRRADKLHHCIAGMESGIDYKIRKRIHDTRACIIWSCL